MIVSTKHKIKYLDGIINHTKREIKFLPDGERKRDLEAFFIALTPFCLMMRQLAEKGFSISSSEALVNSGRLASYMPKEKPNKDLQILLDVFENQANGLKNNTDNLRQHEKRTAAAILSDLQLLKVNGYKSAPAFLQFANIGQNQQPKQTLF